MKPCYTYGNSKWLDLLTAFNDEPIAYEGQTYNAETNKVSGNPVSGNPISYFNGTRWSFDWENGRQLASASTTNGDTTIDIAYTYDINGLRTSKTVTYTTQEEHTHSYTSTVTAPTCLDAGYTTYTCDCGHSYTGNTVAALGHNYVQNGDTYTCSRCGNSYTELMQEDVFLKRQHRRPRLSRKNLRLRFMLKPLAKTKPLNAL